MSDKESLPQGPNSEAIDRTIEGLRAYADALWALSPEKYARFINEEYAGRLTPPPVVNNWTVISRSEIKQGIQVPIETVTTQEDVERLTDRISADLPQDRISKEALERFMLGLSANPNIQGVVFVDLPQSITRPGLEVSALWREPQTRSHLEAMDEVTHLHTDFIAWNESSLSDPYNSWLNIVDPRGAPSVSALVESIAANYEGSSAKIIAGIEFQHEIAQPTS